MQRERGESLLGFALKAAKEEQGFKRAHQEWLTAWDIPKPKKTPKEEPAQQPAQQPADEAKQAA